MMYGNCDIAGVSTVDKVFESCAPLLSSVPSCSSEEDAENGNSSSLYNLPGYIDFSIPYQQPEQFEDPYVLLLNSSPRIGVPIGPDHQAEVPEWDPSASREDYTDNDWEQRYIGTCIIPTPELNESRFDEVAIGRGRTDCSCLDMGSMRCVKQHVQEERQKLKETIGEEAFTKLGFYDMGEEVSWKWTADEQQDFQEVVFTNPMSHGGEFWQVLPSVFPTRTKKDLVNYYFNVFMLRRRAVQNRSFYLQIDSDDDEEHQSAREVYNRSTSLLGQDTDDENDLKCAHGDFYQVREEDEDSEFEPLHGEDLDAGWVDDNRSEPENVFGYEGIDKSYGTSAGNDCAEDDDEKVSGQETKK